MIVRWDGPTVRLYSRNAYDWTMRLAAIAAAELIKAESFTIDGEAVVLGPDGLSRFEEFSRRGATRIAILYAFDLIDGEHMCDPPFLDQIGGAGAAAGKYQGGHSSQRHRPFNLFRPFLDLF
jgi:ATP-dependent DNA ligase